MRIIRNICRLFLGLVFIYSGFVKSVDPIGLTYKLTDYFNAFSLPNLNFIIFFLAFLLPSIEFIVGICLVFNAKIKWSATASLIIMAIFTPLTLLLALWNPVADCGCFGDALVLTNWETFFKNIALLISALIIFKLRNEFKSPWQTKEQLIWIALPILFISSISVYSYKHLPIIDFRAYKTGINIPDAMSIPDGEQTDEYESIFKYRNIKTAEIHEFNEDNYPWKDSLNWEFVDIKQVIIKKGYHPSINDFSIMHPYNGDISEQILNNQGYSFLLISYDINKYNKSSQNKINKLSAFCQANAFDFYCITSSLEEDTQKFAKENNVDYEFCNMDETQLKTIIRSNPGLLLLRNGTILKKWHYNDIPSIEELSKNDILSICIKEGEENNTLKLIITFGLLWLLSFFITKTILHKKNTK